MASLAQPARKPRSPGRPKDAAKRAAIIAAARDLVYERGFEATTMEDVAARAGVSKVTVYGHFGDKLTLFEAAVRHAVAFMEQGLIQPQPHGATLAERLAATGLALLRFLSSPQLVAFDRMLAAEAVRHPELARRFYEAGPAHCCERLAALIAAGHAAGEVDVADPARAAEDMMGLWLGLLHKKLAMGRLSNPSVATLDAHVRHGVRLFMRAYAPG